MDDSRVWDEPSKQEKLLDALTDLASKLVADLLLVGIAVFFWNRVVAAPLGWVQFTYWQALVIAEIVGWLNNQ